MQFGELQKIEPQLKQMGYQIISVSPDRPERLRQSIEKHGLSYRLLSDSAMTAARAFGIAFTLDAKTLEQYKGYGVDLEEASGEKHHALPVPSVFILGVDGTIKFEYVNPDYKVRLDPAVLLAAARAALK